MFSWSSKFDKCLQESLNLNTATAYLDLTPFGSVSVVMIVNLPSCPYFPLSCVCVLFLNPMYCP
jgi:hypothetical protein